MRKIINAEGQEFVPVSTDDLVLDAVPTVNSFNSVTSDAVARAVAGASGEVPQVTENDNGKVLSAIYDEGGPAVEWAEAPSGLPDTTGASQGDVLSIGSTGPEWAAPSGGSSNVEIITLSSSAAAALDTFAAAVHTAYAAGKVVVAKLVNVDSIYTMYLPMIKAYEGETKQYFFGGQGMYYSDDDYMFHPEEYFMYVYDYGDPHCEAVFSKARPTELGWSPFSA